MADRNRMAVPEKSGDASLHALETGTTLKDFSRKTEQEYIAAAMRFTSDDMEKAATLPGISLATLYRKKGLPGKKQ